MAVVAMVFVHGVDWLYASIQRQHVNYQSMMLKNQYVIHAGDVKATPATSFHAELKNNLI